MEKMRHNSIKITQLVSGRGRQNPGQAQTYSQLSLSSSERRGRWHRVGDQRIARDGGRRQHQGWEREEGTRKEGTEVGLLIQGPLFFPTIILDMFSEPQSFFL